MVCRDGCEAAALDGGDDRALRLDAAARLRVVGVRDELLLAGTDLQRERALRRLRQHHVRLEPQADLVGEPETVEAARREDDRVEPALAALAQPRVDVAAQRLDRERGLEREQLCTPARGRRADAHLRLDRRRTAERVARIVTLEIRADRETFGIARRHVLRAVHGDVDPAGEQRLLELLDEDAARADLPERLRAVLVAGGRDRHQRDLDARGAQT